MAKVGNLGTSPTNVNQFGPRLPLETGDHSNVEAEAVSTNKATDPIGEKRDPDVIKKQCFGSVFIEPGSGSRQKYQSGSGSRRPLYPDPDPSYFLALSENNIRLLHNSKILSSKEVT